MSRAMRNQRRLIFVGQKILIPISVVNSKQEDNGCPGAVTGTTPVSVAPPSLEPVCRAESGQEDRGLETPPRVIVPLMRFFI